MACFTQASNSVSTVRYLVYQRLTELSLLRLIASLQINGIAQLLGQAIEQLALSVIMTD